MLSLGSPLFLPVLLLWQSQKISFRLVITASWKGQFIKSLFFTYCPANFEVAPLLIWGKQKTEIAPGLETNNQPFLD